VVTVSDAVHAGAAGDRAGAAVAAALARLLVPVAPVAPSAGGGAGGGGGGAAAVPTPMRVVEHKVVPAAPAPLQAVLRQWCDEGSSAGAGAAGPAGGAVPVPVQLVVTVGGTGFALCDGVPEAVAPLLQREAPGIVQAMLRAAAERAPTALLARPVAGTRGRTLVVTLPGGSAAAALDGLAAVAPALPHALALLLE
jgi:molybdopterin biosynthesis enzyme MoaB